MKKFRVILALVLACLFVFTACKSGSNIPVSVSTKNDVTAEILNSSDKPVNKRFEAIKNFNYNDFKMHYDINLELSDNFGAFVEDTFDTNGVADALEMIGLKNAGLCFDGNIKDSLANLAVYALVNNTNVAEASALFDIGGETLYFSVPTLNDKSVGVDLSGLLSEIDSESIALIYNSFWDYYLALIDFYSKYDEERLSAIFMPYAETILEIVGKDAVSTENEITFAGKKRLVTSVYMEIDESDALEVCLAVLKQLRDDENVKVVIKDFEPVYGAICTYVESMGEELSLDYDEDEIYNAFIEVVDAAIAELEETEVESDGEYLELIIDYIDGKFAGFILGESDNDLYSLIDVDFLNDNGNVEFNLWITHCFLLNVNGTEEDGVFNGVAEFFVIENPQKPISFKINIEDFYLSEDGTSGKGALSFYGDSFEGVNYIPENLGFRISFDQPDLFESSVTIDVLNNREPVASLEISGSMSEGADNIEVPASYIDMESDEEFEAWIMEVYGNVSVILENLVNAGINESLISMMLM